MVCLGVGGKIGKGKMGKGMMMIKSSFNGLAATGAGMACSVSQEKVVTWIAVSPAVTVVLDATDGPTQADEGTVSLAAYTCRGKRTANTVITSTLTDERGRAHCGESCQSEETVEASHCAVRTWATKEYSLQTLTFFHSLLIGSSQAQTVDVYCFPSLLQRSIHPGWSDTL